MWHLGAPFWQLGLRAVIIYVAFLAALRVFGKREVGQFTIFDLVLILLVANAVQPAITGPDASVTGGAIIMAALFGVNALIALVRVRSSGHLRQFLEGQPAVIAQDGHWLPNVMHHEGVDLEDATMALREHGLADVSEVELAVLEVDGSISVVPKEAGALKRGRRRLKYRRRLT
jgi:uncharacterized membrane protein YcaP (DUF421 family)